MPRLVLNVTFLVVACCALSVLGQETPTFRVHVLNSDSEFSAATAFDFNDDGDTDVISGAYWYEAPTWRQHRFRDVQQIRGRFDDYSNLPLDVDGDGDIDIVSVNYRSKSLYWCANPGTEALGQLWSQHEIDRPGTSETGRLVDIDGDGQLDVLPAGTSFAAWYEVVAVDSGEVQWRRHDLPKELIGHGIGAGDINGDGRIDVVGPRGWAEAPEDPRRGRWVWHEDFQLARDCGLPILVVDVDQDGDQDLIWGRGHNVGLYWTEQLADASPNQTEGTQSQSDRVPLSFAAKWQTHAIDTRYSCLHTLMLADIDGDESDDLVAGRRFMGHDGKDPGENNPLSIDWYSFDRDTHSWKAHSISSGGKIGIDLDSTCVDIDQDGDIDILAPARSGLHLLENLRVDDPGSEAEDIATRSQLVAKQAPYQLLEYRDANGLVEVASQATDIGKRRDRVLQQLERVMGELPNSHARVPLEVTIENSEETEKYIRLSVSFTAEPGDRVPAFLLVPKNFRDKRLPAMLCLHPTHFELGKAQICGMGGKPSRFYAHELANRGYVCLAPDYPGFADYHFEFEDSPHASGSMKAIWNNIRAVDLLEGLPFVDGDRIGVIGHSLGGHNALFTAAFEQRLRCVVSSCGFTAFEDYYGGDLQGWTSDRYMARIESQFGNSPDRIPFDFPEILLAIAPRPLFVNAPLHDSNFEVRGVQKCERAISEVYRLLKKPELLHFDYPDAEHDFPESQRQAAYAWLDQQLLR